MFLKGEMLQLGMAKLPQDKEENTIGKMKVGETGYTVPWAMWVDKERNCWLNEDYTIHKGRGGTVQLKIERLKEGYIAYINDKNLNEKWNPTSSPGYCTPEEKLYGKVIGFDKKNCLDDKLRGIGEN